MLAAILGLAGTFGTGLLGLVGTVAPGIATALGDVFLKYQETKAKREDREDEHGRQLAGSWLNAVTESNRMRAQARKDEGAWGPLGIVTFAIGMAFAYHVWMIVLDSTPWSLFGLLKPHVIGSWHVATLGKFHEVELAAIQALFYVAPPAAAAVIAAKAFRRS